MFAFYLPGQTPTPSRCSAVASSSSPSTPVPRSWRCQTYLSTDKWANAKVATTPAGGWVSANKGLDANKLSSPIDKLAAKLLQDPKSVFRFDGSDQMPAAVGSNAFWKQATNWIVGQSTQDTVNNIENAWPK